MEEMRREILENSLARREKEIPTLEEWRLQSPSDTQLSAARHYLQVISHKFPHICLIKGLIGTR